MIRKNNTDYSLSELMPQSDNEKYILSQRAHHLAQSVTVDTKVIETNHYVRFKLGTDQLYGIPYQYIKEVMLNMTPTRVPNTPEWIAGIINRHGILISVLDLKPFFHIQHKEKPNQTYLIILHFQNVTCALLADTIEGSYRYVPSTLESPLTTESAIKPKYILGLDQGITALLNIETLLADLQFNKKPVKERKR